jgi:hypothetical protein
MLNSYPQMPKCYLGRYLEDACSARGLPMNLGYALNGSLATDYRVVAKMTKRLL